MDTKKISTVKRLSFIALSLFLSVFINNGLHAQVVASFTPSKTSGCAPLSVSFVNTSTTGASITYAWNFGNGLTSSSKNPSTSYASSGSYTVTLTVTNTTTSESDIATATISVISGLSAEFSMSKNAVCPNESVTFTLGTTTGVTSYTWDLNDGTFINNVSTIQHSYPLFDKYIPKLIISGPSGSCEIQDSLEVYEVVARIEFTDTNFCNQRKVYLANQSTGNDNNHWDFGNGETSDEVVPYPIFNTGNYIITLNISNTYGCKDTTSVSIQVDNTPDLELGQGWYVCINDTVQLQASGGHKISWSPSTNLSSSTSYTPLAYPTSTTYYMATISDTITHCNSTGYIAVFVQKEPNWNIVNIALSKDTLIIGDTVKLITEINDSISVFDYLWSPNYNITCTSCASPIIQPLTSTTYSVLLADTNGCFSHVIEIPIIVRQEHTVELPDAFTPDGDIEANKIIYCKGWGIKNLIEFRIYNRWGIEVFFTDDINQGWDGYYKGKLQNIDTYLYFIKAEMWAESGETYITTKKGSFNLLK